MLVIYRLYAWQLVSGERPAVSVSQAVSRDCITSVRYVSNIERRSIVKISHNYYSLSGSKEYKNQMAINTQETALYAMPPSHNGGDPAAWRQVGLTHPDFFMQAEAIDKIPSSFPDMQATLDYYEEQFKGSFANLNVREVRRWDGGREAANATVIQTDEAPIDVENPEVRKEALRSCVVNIANNARFCSWWCDIKGSLKQLKDEEPSSNEMMIFAKHTFTPTVDGAVMQVGYEVYEMGAPSDETDIEIVANTLNIIDQYSGGALVGSRVVLVNDMSNRGSDESLGINSERATYLNIKAIHELAESSGVSPSDILATALVHELLGHGLERWRFGDAGVLFPEHFEYSEDFTEGDIYKAIHTAIRAKDEAYQLSQPVREYGAVTPAEDLAASVDAEVAKAENWQTGPIPRLASKTDEYRRDLIMQMMGEAAEMVNRGAGNPGFVGAEIRYIKDNKGNVVGSGPARTLEHTVVDAQTAIKQEMEDIASKFIPQEIIVVRSIPAHHLI